MANILNREVANVFIKDNPEYGYADAYLAELRTSWRENERGITRSSALIVGLAVVFEFVYNNKASATFLGVQITSANVLRFSLVVIIAYLYYVIIYSFIESDIFYSVHAAVIEKVYPALYEANGDSQLSPTASLIGSVERVGNALKNPSLERTLAATTGAIRPILIIIAPPLFIVVAYIQLFVKYGLSNGLLWGSLVISGLLLIAGGCNVYLLMVVSNRSVKS